MSLGEKAKEEVIGREIIDWEWGSYEFNSRCLGTIGSFSEQSSIGGSMIEGDDALGCISIRSSGVEVVSLSEGFMDGGLGMMRLIGGLRLGGCFSQEVFQIYNALKLVLIHHLLGVGQVFLLGILLFRGLETISIRVRGIFLFWSMRATSYQVIVLMAPSTIKRKILIVEGEDLFFEFIFY